MDANGEKQIAFEKSMEMAETITPLVPSGIQDKGIQRSDRELPAEPQRL
jgi:hypothetical protein